jgi:hypothetical protein
VKILRSVVMVACPTSHLGTGMTIPKGCIQQAPHYDMRNAAGNLNGIPKEVAGLGSGRITGITAQFKRGNLALFPPIKD